MIFGLCDASGYAPRTPAELNAWKALGISYVRFGFDASVIFRSGTVNADKSVDLTPNWAPIDPQIAALRGAGIAINWNLVWIPAWASDGIPAYQRYETGWWDVITISDVRYNHPGIDPPHLNREAIRAFGRAIAQRYGARDDTWSFGNEPGGGYWPPSQGTDASKAACADRFVDEGWLPFLEGVRDVLPDAKSAGPESDGADIHRRILQCLRDRGMPPPDAITLHPYGDPQLWPNDSYRLMADYWRVMTRELRQDRPVWISEIGGTDLDLWMDYVLRMLSRGTDYQTRFDFVAVNLGGPATFVAADGSLTELGGKIKAITGKVMRAGT